MIIYDMQQGSDDWLKVRIGKVTASRVKDVMAKGQGKTRKGYLFKLLAELDSGIQQDSYKNTAMDWGVEMEPQARLCYEETNYTPVKQVGFVELNKYVGCSPDGLVGDDGLVEIKCPNTSTHLEYIFTGKMPTEYVKQVQFQLWVTGRGWCDFVSYDPRSHRPLWCIRVERDEKLITEIEKEVNRFIDELKTMIAELKKPSEDN